MVGTVFTFTFAIIGAQAGNGGHILDCKSPLELLQIQLERRPTYAWPVPGSPLSYSKGKARGIRVSLMPDLIGFEDEPLRPGKSWSFSTSTSSRSLKAQLLKRVGLVESRSRSFGATFSFANAPNWAFQFRGMRRVTIAYITRF